MFRNDHKCAKKCKMCSTYGSSVRNNGNTIRMNEFVLDFKSVSLWLLLGIIFSSQFQSLFLSNLRPKSGLNLPRLLQNKKVQVGKDLLICLSVEKAHIHHHDLFLCLSELCDRVNVCKNGIGVLTLETVLVYRSS